MPSNDRISRLAEELKVMQALASDSNILEFSSEGDPPNEYDVTLRGKGINRGSSFKAKVEFLNEHKFEIRLGYSYPERPPDVRWKSSIYHPNITYSGFIKLEESGLEWDKNMTLEVVCERMWDLARLAHLDLNKASNYSAKKWFAGQTEIALPVDQRPLRDRRAPSPENIVRYHRGPSDAGKPPAKDILYIGEDTPTPQLPQRRRDDEDILFIE